MPAVVSLVPLTVVVPAQISEVVIAGAAVVATVTELETALIHFPEAVANAVMALPADNAGTVAVHAVSVAVTVTGAAPLT